MTVDAPRVFVSYAHESDEHKAAVLALATVLRDTGIDTVLDQWSTGTRRDWYSWAIQEMTAADFVLVVASERYRHHGDGFGQNPDSRGVQSEAALLRELVHSDRATWLRKVLPVLLPGHEIDEIPLFLQPYSASRYPVTSFDAAGAEELLHVLRGHPDPATRKPYLPPHTPKPAPDSPRVVNQINGTVHGRIIQADTITGDIHFY